LRTEARLSLHCKDPEVAIELEQVLTPDNVGMPYDQRFTMTRKGRTLVFVVDSESPVSTSSTLFSILRDVSLFQEIWLLSRGVDAVVGSRQ
jgi:tRNA threonylcarbamoyladenosine modification (KEOPS) complex  Pcc1 subunit